MPSLGQRHWERITQHLTMIHETEMKIFTLLAIIFIIIRGAFPNAIAVNQFSFPHTILLFEWYVGIVWRSNILLHGYMQHSCIVACNIPLLYVRITAFKVCLIVTCAVVHYIGSPATLWLTASCKIHSPPVHLFSDAGSSLAFGGSSSIAAAAARLSVPFIIDV